MASAIARCAGVSIFGLLAACHLAPAAPAQDQPADAVSYKFVNKTGGKFTDEQCFWSLNGGKDWHSFAREPTVRCPAGNGRVYFRVGAAPKNFDDRTATWD